MLDLPDTLSLPHDEAALRVQRRLLDRVRDALAGSNGATQTRIVRVAVPVGDVDPLRWLRTQAVAERIYWSGRDDGRTVGALGMADALMSNDAPLDYDALADRIAERFASGTQAGAARYYGGIRFDARQPAAQAAADWQPFGTYRFVLPRFELVRGAERTVLVCNLVLPRDVYNQPLIEAQIRQLEWPEAPVGRTLPRPVQREDTPERARWMAMVRDALASFDAGRLEKVVFARKASLHFSETLDAYLLLDRLQRDTPNCFHFGFQLHDELAFIGASPERLLRREGARLVSEAVAGTRSRADSARADRALRDELLESDKDRREHAHVLRFIRERLQALGADVAPSLQASEMRLARGRHLQARIEATLQAHTSTFDVLAALHPTPAVGGVPTQAALDEIRRQEPFDRGWYAGPVGWIGKEAAEFAVAIRSGLVQGASLDLYSGAGLVQGSVPNEEWDEIEHKIGDFAAILDLDEALSATELSGS